MTTHKIKVPVVNLEHLKKQIAEEIKDHRNWCSATCYCFLPEVYKMRRLEGDSAKQLQNDYDSCHIFR